MVIFIRKLQKKKKKKDRQCEAKKKCKLYFPWVVSCCKKLLPVPFQNVTNLELHFGLINLEVEKGVGNNFWCRKQQPFPWYGMFGA